MPPLKSCKDMSEITLKENNNFVSLSTTDNIKLNNSYNYFPKLLSNLNVLRLSKSLCDVEIIADGKIITVS